MCDVKTKPLRTSLFKCRLLRAKGSRHAEGYTDGHTKQIIETENLRLNDKMLLKKFYLKKCFKMIKFDCSSTSSGLFIYILHVFHTPYITKPAYPKLWLDQLS